MNVLLVRMTACIATVAAIGCSSGQPDGLGPIEDFVGQFKQAACENDVTCGVMPDVDTCMATTFPERDQGAKTLAAAIEAGRVQFKAGLVPDCLTAVRTMPCTVTARTQGATVCATLFTGTLALGDACVLDAECVSGACYHPLGSGSCGAGSCARVVGVGAVCEGDSGAVCGTGMYCFPSAPGSMVFDCHAYVTEGEACNIDPRCDPTLLCPFDSTTMQFTQCTRRPQEGEPCEPDTIGPWCDRLDDYCDPTTKVCTPIRAVGASCDVPAQCPAYAFCDGTCVEQPFAGACSAQTGGCLGQVACHDGTCTEPDDDNACPLP